MEGYAQNRPRWSWSRKIFIGRPVKVGVMTFVTPNSPTTLYYSLPTLLSYADLGEFIDVPIRTYSSGMRARLGFSIATAVEPDILILDEVLSTGDAAFRAKSKQRVGELVTEAKAIVLVTHDMNWVTEYCNRAMLIENGRIVADGAPRDVVDLHQQRSAERRAAAQAAGVFRLAGPERRGGRRRRR